MDSSMISKRLIILQLILLAVTSTCFDNEERSNHLRKTHLVDHSEILNSQPIIREVKKGDKSDGGDENSSGGGGNNDDVGNESTSKNRNNEKSGYYNDDNGNDNTGYYQNRNNNDDNGDTGEGDDNNNGNENDNYNNDDNKNYGGNDNNQGTNKNKFKQYVHTRAKEGYKSTPVSWGFEQWAFFAVIMLLFGTSFTLCCMFFVMPCYCPNAIKSYVRLVT
jgi:hypothetical protein